MVKKVAKKVQTMECVLESAIDFDHAAVAVTGATDVDYLATGGSDTVAVVPAVFCPSGLGQALSFAVRCGAMSCSNCEKIFGLPPMMLPVFM